MEKKSNAPKSGRRAVIHYMKGKTLIRKEVPASRALMIADEYRRKTGNSVRIKIT